MPSLFNEDEDFTDYENHTGCPACGSDNYIGEDDGMPGYPPVYRCEECGEEWT